MLGDVVSSSEADDFSNGQVGLAIKDESGKLEVRVGPLVTGAGKRLIDEMDVPGAGSLRSLANSMEVTDGETPDGDSAEFLLIEVER